MKLPLRLRLRGHSCHPPPSTFLQPSAPHPCHQLGTTGTSGPQQGVAHWAAATRRPASAPLPPRPHPSPPGTWPLPCPAVSGAESGGQSPVCPPAAHRQAPCAEGAASGAEAGGSEPSGDGTSEQWSSTGRVSLSRNIFGGRRGAGARDAVTYPTVGRAGSPMRTLSWWGVCF